MRAGTTNRFHCYPASKFPIFAKDLPDHRFLLHRIHNLFARYSINLPEKHYRSGNLRKLNGALKYTKIARKKQQNAGNLFV